jgi:hypothetical protein
MGKSTKIKKCKKCGGDEFLIQETIIHVAAACPEDGELIVFKEWGGGIDRISCKKREAEYMEEDFKNIIFR